MRQRAKYSVQRVKKVSSSAPILSAPKDGEELFLYLVVSDVVVSAAMIREKKIRSKNWCSMQAR